MPPIKKLWISSPMATGQVNVDRDNIIIKAPPIWQKFYGAHSLRLIMWLNNKYGKESVEVLEMNNVTS